VPRSSRKQPDPTLELIWSYLQPLFIHKRDSIFEGLAKHDLTPPHGQALTQLAAGPMRMRDMADHLMCDASYITVVVDNLENRGLAERRPSTTDRRVKEIALTDAGRVVAADIERIMSAPPEALAALSTHDRRVLADILSTLALDTSASMWAKPGHRRTREPADAQ
jgi:DNA-binding MarR family transcriptional regulator